MRLTLAQLEAFYWIARLGSFRATARQLNLTQPTISLRIRELEQTLSVSLFERGGRRVRLTADGSALRLDVERILTTTSRIESRAAAQAPLHGLFRFGAPEGFAVVCLPTLVRWLEQTHPQLRLEVVISTSDELMAMVKARRLDLALIANPLAADSHVRVEALGHFEMLWVASPQLNLPRVVRPHNLGSQNIIANAHTSPMYRMIQDWFLSSGLVPERVDMCNSLAVISRLVAAGIGVSVLPSHLLKSEIEAGKLILLESRPKLPVATMAAAYPVNEAGPSSRVIVNASRNVMIQAGFMQPVSGQ